MRSCFREGLTPRMRKAARLMFVIADEDVAKEMGVRVGTVEKWRERPEVKAEIRRLHGEFKAAVARFVVRQAHDAAIKFRDAIEKGDAKILLDTLKASGAFDFKESEGSGETIDAVLERIARGPGYVAEI